MAITGRNLHKSTNIPWVFNEDGNDAADLRAESDSQTHMLFVDASTNRVGIANSAPTTALDVTGTITATGLAVTGTQTFTGDQTINGGLVVNEAGADEDTRIESDTNTHAFIVDGGLFTGVGAIGLGAAATDAAAVLLDNPAFTATAATNVAKLRVENSAAITVPAGTTALAASVSIDEPNLTATGTITTAATLYIEAAPTEGGSNYALFVDAGVSRFDGNLEFNATAAALVGARRTAGTTAVAITGATALALNDSGGIFTVSQAAAYDIDLPSPTTGPGLLYVFSLTAAGANNVTITVLGGAATFVGTIVNDVTSVLPATGSTLTFATGAAALGDTIIIRSIATNLYHVQAVTSTAGGITVS